MVFEGVEKEVYHQPLCFKHEALVDLTLSKSPKDSKEFEKSPNEKGISDRNPNDNIRNDNKPLGNGPKNNKVF